MQTLKRYYYADPIAAFLNKTSEHLLGQLQVGSGLAGASLDTTQSDAWGEQIRILKTALVPYAQNGHIFFEYSIPRLGRRIDVVVILGPVIFVLEFKAGEHRFSAAAIDQVCDYALDLKNFHEETHLLAVAPVLIATGAPITDFTIRATTHKDGLLVPISVAPVQLVRVFGEVLAAIGGPSVSAAAWEAGRYSPTPTIIEAAQALYRGHQVSEISRHGAAADDLNQTSKTVSNIIYDSRNAKVKSICFVTGVPGAGKTLVGLNIATTHIDKASDLHSVLLSGNGPLVAILREALVRDRVAREKEVGRKVKKGTVMSEVKMFIQNVHHFRDDCLSDTSRPPVEHVALFDEAQRAWNLQQTSKFMLQKKKRPDFNQSEPEFLISCLDRHPDWAVIVCLVGGGQEINTGEAGLSEWIESLQRSFPDWHIYLSSRLTDSEYGAGAVLKSLEHRPNVFKKDELHLGVSMRSFRAENVSLLVKQVLDLEIQSAKEILREVSEKFPLKLTRDLGKAKQWLRQQARGSQRYGIVASSQAQRLKPFAIDVRYKLDPIHWFLHGKEDVRSCYYLEDVATEFHVQGLELDWACVTWDADFRYAEGGWQHHEFRGDRWNNVKKAERQRYLKNAYRVLLTRAREGMVIFVPEGDAADPTRKPQYYDPTFRYLRDLGLSEL